MNVPQFETKELLFAHLRANKNIYLTAKKAMLKCADAVECHTFTEQGEQVTKASINPKAAEMESFEVVAAINTTNLMDSHDDVHLPGLWSKSLKENKMIYHLQEHQMSFKNIISDEVKATAKKMDWAELGYKYEGQTEVLLFKSTITKDRNEYMAEQYAKGRVKNHSVGMRYVKIDLAMNSDSPADAKEKAVWNKYISQIANKDHAIEQGYFWAVTEAKVIEGSAVPLGSNFATPTISVGEPTKATPIEPEQSTRKTGYEIFNY